MKAFSLSLILIFTSVLPLFSQPKIHFDHTDHDFGEVVENSYPKAYFKLFNQGNEPLTLLEVKTSCGCTTPHWPKEAIMPGDSSQIEVVFNSRGYTNKDFAKSVIVTYDTDNKGTSKVVVLYIHGKVIPKHKPIPQYPLIVKNNTIDLGYIRYGKDQIYQFELVNEGDSVIGINEITSSSPASISFSWTPLSIPPREKVIITLVYHGKSHEPRTFMESFKINTSLDQKFTEELSKKGFTVVGEVLDKKTYKLKEKESK